MGTATAPNAEGLQPADWERAVVSQSACNLSGLAHWLVTVLDKMRNDGVVGTDQRNQHPIVRLVVAQWRIWPTAALTATMATSGRTPTRWRRKTARSRHELRRRFHGSAEQKVPPPGSAWRQCTRQLRQGRPGVLLPHRGCRYALRLARRKAGSSCGGFLRRFGFVLPTTECGRGDDGPRLRFRRKQPYRRSDGQCAS